MLLALDTATDRASVALGTSEDDAVEESLPGARRHASALLPMVQSLLLRRGASIAEITALVVADGPGSFTGLRVGASVAKALVRVRDLPLWVAPSLLVRAAGVASPGATVVAVSDALRGDIYAAAFRFSGQAIVTTLAPSVCRPGDMPSLVDGVDAIVGDVPEAAGATLEQWAGRPLVRSPEGAPSARRLLGLVGREGGARRSATPQTWEPDYGRPAEAQARWEMAHGRPLSDSAGSPR